MANIVQSIESRVLALCAECVDKRHPAFPDTGDIEQKIGLVCRIVGVEYDSKVDDAEATVAELERRTIPRKRDDDTPALPWEA